MDRTARDKYLASQPAGLFINMQSTLPELPMFLEDGLYGVSTGPGKWQVLPCYFLGYNEHNKILVKKSGDSKITETTKFLRLGTFTLHRGELIRKSNDTTNLIRIVFDANEQETTEYINSISIGSPSENEEDYIPVSFKQAIQLPEWKSAIDSEVAALKATMYSHQSHRTKYHQIK